ncbi:MAG: hypothetical protein IKV41_00735 [Oscillospiraceae bacterium]|nr:hypothetical protein [Oscillospiraceae bacterium]
MEQRTMRQRASILAAFLGLIVVLYIIRLMNLQVVHGQEYKSMSNSSTARTQTIESTRGEIVDRNGSPLASNKISYDIILDRAFLPYNKKATSSSERDDSENDIILAALELLNSQGEEWIDNLPITMEKPYRFISGKEKQVEALKTSIQIGLYNDVNTTYKNLLEWYDLTDAPYTDQQKRWLAGVHYQMDLSGFSVRVPYVLAKDVSIDTVTKMRERSFSLEGVDYQQSTARQYVDGDVAPHIIGTIGMLTAEEYTALTEQGKTFKSEKETLPDSRKYLLSDFIGKAGIEYAMEDTLRGSTGTRRIVINNKGDVLESEVTQEAIPGSTVVLTLDSVLQRTATQALLDEIAYLNANAPEGQGREADAGAVVAVEVKTGEVLVACNVPSYNLESYRQDIDELLQDPKRPLVNRALMGQYRPGSTFKPIVATAGLATDLIEGPTTVDCTYQYKFYDDYQPYCLSHHGPIDVYGAIKHSCNIFFYDVGRRLGISEINRYAQAYGLGQPTGIEIGESKGRLSSPDFSQKMGSKWYDGNVLQAAIGQLDTEVTPIQLANYAATIANKGKRMKLHLVKSVQSFDFAETIYENEPVVVDTVDASLQDYKVLTDAMVQTQRTGSASMFLGDYPIDVACKTGTPETTKSGFPNSTFICFAPADDPQIAVAVVIEKGWHGYTGAPVARAVLDQYFYGSSAPAKNPPVNQILE